MEDEKRVVLISRLAQLQENPEMIDKLTPEEEFKLLLAVLQKSPYYRSQTDILLIQRRCAKVPFFQSLVSQEGGGLIFEKCCRKMQYLYVSAGQLIFAEGQKGDCFYVLLKGRVSVYKSFQGSERELTQLGDGSSFGELALINDSPRSASVKAIMNCQFAILDSQDFNLLVKMIKMSMQRKYFEEFARLRAISRLQFFVQKALYENAEVEEYGINSTIFKQGQKLDKVYIIHTGEIKLIKTLSHPDTTQIEDPMETFLPQKSYQSSNNERVNIILSYSGKQPIKKKSLIQIRLVGQGELFGDFELLELNQVRQFTAITTQQENRCFSINAQKYIEILKNDFEAVDRLKVANSNKRQLFANQIIHRFTQLTSVAGSPQSKDPNNSQDLNIFPKDDQIIITKNANNGINALKTSMSIHSSKYASQKVMLKTGLKRPPETSTATHSRVQSLTNISIFNNESKPQRKSHKRDYSTFILTVPQSLSETHIQYSKDKPESSQISKGPKLARRKLAQIVKREERPKRMLRIQSSKPEQ